MKRLILVIISCIFVATLTGSGGPLWQCKRNFDIVVFT